MTDERISELTTLAGASVASGDEVEILDVSDATFAPSGTNKKITASELATAITSIGALSTDAETAAAAAAAEAFAIQRANHTGTQSADTLTDGTTNKAFLATERTKLSGIATGATANSSDATLLARANHTGTQAESTVTNLVTDLAAKAPLVSPALTGTPTAPTATVGTNTTQVATTAFVIANAGGGGGSTFLTGADSGNSFMNFRVAHPSVTSGSIYQMPIQHWGSVLVADGGPTIEFSGTTVNGDATVTSSTAVFTSDHVGWGIFGTGLQDGGAAPCTIVSINSSTSVEVSNPAIASNTYPQMRIHPYFSPGTDGSAHWVNILRPGLYKLQGLVTDQSGDDGGTAREMTVSFSDWAGNGYTNDSFATSKAPIPFVLREGFNFSNLLVVNADMCPAYAQASYFQDSGSTQILLTDTPGGGEVAAFHTLGVSVYLVATITEA